jgi:hypothetical protein
MIDWAWFLLGAVAVVVSVLLSELFDHMDDGSGR